jgi:hypothetical protein
VAILLDTVTKGEYDALTLSDARASAVVSALGSSVVVEVYDGSDVLRASGTMADPWATASGATVTVGEVTGVGLLVTSGGAPDANWYCQFRGGARFVRGTFGVLGEARDFVWSLTSFQTGSRGTLGSVVLRTTGTTDNPNPVNIGYVMENVVQDAYVGIPYTQTLTITGRWLYDNPSDVPSVSLINGSTLPAGLTLNTALVNLGYARGVQITGTATSVGTTSIDVRVTNSAGSTTKTIPFNTRALDPNRVNPSDMQWIGSFRLKQVRDVEQNITGVGFNGRGYGMAVSSDRLGLFFVAGSSRNIAEYTIPTDFSYSALYTSLPVAQIRQPYNYAFGPFTQQELQEAEGIPPGSQVYDITGIAVSGSDLLITGWYYYDSGGYTKYQIIRRPSDLSLSSPVISSSLGVSAELRYWVGGVDKIPTAFATANGLAPFSVGRMGGSIDSTLSRGPTIGAFDPAAMTHKGSVPVEKLVAYQRQQFNNLGDQSLAFTNGYNCLGDVTINAQNKWYASGSTTSYATFWCEAKPVILFIGHIGLGSPWYDLSSGANTDNRFPPFAVEDLTFAHGNHGAPYYQYVWAMDQSEVAAVKAGTKLPHQANVYDVWPLPPTPYSRSHPEQPWLGGVAHDPVSRRIYVAQPARDVFTAFVKWPVIDVYGY